MIAVFLSLFGIFVFLVLSEYLWREKKIKGEIARKFVHMSVGTFVAFWPYFMSWQTIQLISLAFLAVVVFSMVFKTFHAIHAIKRKTWGELFFPIGIGVVALLQPSPIVFMAAILHLSLADSLAAVVGTKFARANHKFYIRKEKRSLVGMAAFWLVSTLIIGSIALVPGSGFGLVFWPLVLCVPLIMTWVEVLSIYGSDNIFIPVVATILLSSLQVL